MASQVVGYAPFHLILVLVLYILDYLYLIENETICISSYIIRHTWYTPYLIRGVSVRVAEDKQNGTPTSPGHLESHL